MSRPKIKFGLIGAGLIGKRHAEILTRHPRATLAGIADIREREALYIDQFDVQFYKNHEQLLCDDRIDAVCVATPNGLHAAHVTAALKAGKHVVVEKPLALSSKDAENILSTAKRLDKKVFCVMQNRFSPAVAELKKIVENNILGKIFSVQINCFWNRDDRYYFPKGWRGTEELDGGVLYTQFSHFIDILVWIFGGVRNISARFKNFTHAHSTDFEDSGIVTFDLEGGGIGNLHYSTAVWDRNFESSITVLAEKGTVKIGGQYMNTIDYCHINGYQMPELPQTNPANNYGVFAGSAANHGQFFDQVINVLSGEFEEDTNLRDAVKVTSFIEDVYQLKKQAFLEHSNKG